MEYSYVAANNTGTKQKGIIEARSEKDIVEFLKKNNLTPITIKRASKSTAIPFLGNTNISHSDVVLLTRQLASMLLTGLTLIESLTVLKKQSKNDKMEMLLEDIISNVSEGKTFSQSLSSHKNLFSDVYISLIKAAEAGGLMDKILDRLALNLEKSEDIKKNIKSALFYPAIIVVGMIGVVIVMNVMVIPQLGSLYEGMDMELPTMTKFVLGMSKFTINYWPILVASVIFTFLFLKWFSKSESGIRILDKLKLKMPVFGDIIILSSLHEITTTFSLLIRSGTSVLESLEISANVSGNIYYKEAVLSARKLVEKGVSISNAFENQQIFPQLLIQMIKVGEETGKMDENLDRVAEYFERDLSIKIKTLTTAIEPILIVVLGVVVGFLILSVITPIYSLISNIK